MCVLYTFVFTHIYVYHTYYMNVFVLSTSSAFNILVNEKKTNEQMICQLVILLSDGFLNSFPV